MKCITRNVRGVTRKICYQTKHRGIAKNLPAGREPSMAQIRAIHARRSLKARRRDEASLSRHVLSPRDKGKASWVLNPNKWDIRGVDTPMRHNAAHKAWRTRRGAGRVSKSKGRCVTKNIQGTRRILCRNAKGQIVSNKPYHR